MQFMRSSKAQKTLITIKMVVLIALFQNMDMPTSANVAEAANKYRVIHAKELLGNRRPQTIGAAIIKPDVVKRFIEEQVEANLPKKYKAQYEQIAQAILDEANRYELDPMFLMAVIRTESNFNPEARGNHREVGLMQIKPDTAEWLARETKTQWQGLKTLRDPVLNIKLGAKYFSYLREKFDRTAGHYITAYNMGETRLSQLRSKGAKPVIYSSQVMKRYIESYNKLLASEDMPYALN